jgi:hypothetical protein
LPLLLSVLAVALLKGVIAGPLYRLDVNLIYDRQFTRLEETVADMEELRRPSSAARSQPDGSSTPGEPFAPMAHATATPGGGNGMPRNAPPGSTIAISSYPARRSRATA